METKYTPGPWEITNTRHQTDIMGNDKRICSMSEGAHGVSTENMANAKVIAASPDLLEALISAQKHVEAYDEKHGVHPSVRIKIQNAIKKATE